MFRFLWHRHTLMMMIMMMMMTQGVEKCFNAISYVNTKTMICLLYINPLVLEMDI